MDKNISQILISESAIIERIKELGKKISLDYQGEPLTVICILKGAFIFLADLLRNISLHTSVEFIQVSSYGEKTESSGKIKIIQNLSESICNKNVLVVDDILDSGLTLSYMKELLILERPKTLKFCVLLNKSKDIIRETEVDYIGFEIPDRFVVGYGLDYAEQYRGLPYIATLE
ncbi:hypoxanthine phosphoribosyltransferase [Candidatus Poribacteria bacterium]|nr:hypoxanthine phosphoribosyltransferase [Candidatus Poribacteria bacterium]